MFQCLCVSYLTLHVPTCIIIYVFKYGKHERKFSCLQPQYYIELSKHPHQGIVQFEYIIHYEDTSVRD